MRYTPTIEDIKNVHSMQKTMRISRIARQLGLKPSVAYSIKYNLAKNWMVTKPERYGKNARYIEAIKQIKLENMRQGKEAKEKNHEENHEEKPVMELVTNGDQFDEFANMFGEFQKNIVSFIVAEVDRKVSEVQKENKELKEKVTTLENEKEAVKPIIAEAKRQNIGDALRNAFLGRYA